MEFEYKTHKQTAAEILEEVLNRLGQDQWELVSVVYKDGFVAFLKREAKDRKPVHAQRGEKDIYCGESSRAG